MRPKTVLHLTGMHSTKYGGVERYLLGLAKSSSREGYSTTIQYETMPRSRRYLQDLSEAGVEIIVECMGASLVASSSTLARILRTVKPLVVITHFVRGYVHLQLPFMKRWYGIKKLLAMMHGVQHASRSWRHFAFNRYDGVIGVSKRVSDSLTDIGTRPHLVHTHYLGLFAQNTKLERERLRYRNEFGVGEDVILIGCIAFDSQVKGVDLLLEAVSRVKDEFPEIHILIIGIDPNGSRLPAEAARRGIGHRTHWAGLREEGWRLLNAADLYAQPSRSEAMPFAIMEAMELGLPVVATNVGGIPEIVADGETGFLAEPESADFAEAVKKLMAVRDIWEVMGAAGRTRYHELFNGERSVESFVQLYLRDEKHLDYV